MKTINLKEKIIIMTLIASFGSMFNLHEIPDYFAFAAQDGDIGVNEIIANNYHMVLEQSHIVNDLNFSGDYILNGEYNIAIKKQLNDADNAIVIDQYMDYLSTISDYMFIGFDNFVFVDYSLIELEALQGIINPIMEDYMVSSTGIDIINNRLKLAIASRESYALLYDYLIAATGFNYLPIDVNINPYSEVNFSSSVYNGNKIRDMWWFVEIGYGTIGFNAYQQSTNQFGVVTNAHVAKEDVEMKDNSGALIGERTTFAFGGLVDAAFVPFKNQSDWEVTNVVKVQGQSSIAKYITHTSTPLLGASVVKFGATSGQKYGKITSISTSIVVDDVTFTDVIEFSLAIRPGDSGGPIGYYYTKSMSMGLLGITFAGIEGLNITYGIKVSNIESALGVVPIID